MARNVVLCLDGTGNRLKASGNTNVVALYSMLDLSDPEKQIAFYDPGVGTFSSQGALTKIGRKLSVFMGLLVGTGMRTNMAEAYTYLMQNMRPDDKVFIFGFSRGAYTARALIGMLYKVGLLRPGAENLVPYAVGTYARGHQKWSDEEWSEIDKFAETFSRTFDEKVPVPVGFVGVWDTVKAAGLFRWDVKWPFTRQLRNAAVVRHAISIDEYRRPYREYLVKPVPPTPELNQAWFSGVHSDVGGTLRNKKTGKEEPELPRIALKWMLDGALDAGILLEPGAYAQQCTVATSDGASKPHRNGWLWFFATYRRRPIPPKASIHASVKERLAADPTFAKRLPAEYTWEDPDWTVPHSA